MSNVEVESIVARAVAMAIEALRCDMPEPERRALIRAVLAFLGRIGSD